MGTLWHTLKPEEVVIQCRSDAEWGLHLEEADKRLEEVGPNALLGAPGVSPVRIFFGQFKDFMVLVLLGATAISFLLGELGDAITIVAIVIMNAILGFVQEFRAEKSVETLKALTAPTAKVLRQGRLVVLPARDLVPGDIIELESGDLVPADCRILTCRGLEAEEAALTGESASVTKKTDAFADPSLPLGDRRNMVFMGTVISRGRGRAIVVETGMHTEMGMIAHLIREAVEEQTPLQRRLEQLGKILVILSLLIVAIVVITGLFRGEPLYQMFLTGVSLAVAAIPEGLPAIVTIALALGVQRMIRSHAIVRRLPAVETLGCTTVICSDKTGTLTRNKMTVTHMYTVTGHWERDQGGGFANARSVAHDLVRRDFDHLMQGAVLCNNASLNSEEPNREEGAGHGDPTELAMLWAAVEGGAGRPSDLARAYQRTDEIPFESARQRMAVSATTIDGQSLVYVKGAPDVMVTLCTRYQRLGKIMPLDVKTRQEILKSNEAMGAQALRVLAVAYRPLASREGSQRWEQDLIFLGLMGMMDPPRPEAVEAVREARRAGVKTVMITGDHPNTARAIADQLGMLGPGEEVLTGQELDLLSDEELAARVQQIRVYARVSPPHKLRVVKAWKQRGDVVAMTGDGVNDAPAVKEADIGVAMGITGTDVTKEASAMILTDDNFATIVKAIAEGRAIYDNIRKFIRYLLACNVGEVLVMFLAAFFGLPLPLLPIQILFVNLVTDGLPAMALGVDPAAPGVMARPPRHPREGIFARGLGTKIGFRGILIGVSTLLVFLLASGPLGMGLRESRTMALATLIMSQLFHVFDARTEDRSFLEVGLFSNWWIIAAVGSSIVMLLTIVYVPDLGRLFKTDPLGWGDWALVVLASGFVQIGSGLREIVLRPTRRLVANRGVRN